ncbi:MAG: septum formation initiator family protein, partial [Anaerococcus sp.]
MNKANSYSKRRKKKNISFLFTLIALLIISSIAYYVSNAAMNNEINSINKEIVSTQKKLDATNAEINSLKKDYDIRNTDKFK